MYRPRVFAGAALVVVAAAVAALSFALYQQGGRTVTVRIDGQTRTLLTHAATLDAALQEAGLTVYPEDRLLLGDAQAQTLVSDPHLALTEGAVVVVRRAALVRIDADAQRREIRTQLVNAFDILSQTGILLYPADEVWADGVRLTPGQDLGRAPARIAVRRAVTVTVSDGASAFTLETAARTVGEALWLAGHRLRRTDAVSPPLDTPLVNALTITLDPAFPITVQADGQTLARHTRAANVGQALDEIGLPLVGADYALPAADQPLPADGLIRVVRVREEVLTEQELIPRETVYQALPEVEIDNVQQLQAGTDGWRRRYVRVSYEDGVEVSRITEAEVLAQAPSPRVIGYGSKIVIRTVDTPNGPLEYWRAYTMYATSYSPSRAGTPRTARNFGRTASGKLLTFGMVAIDRTMMPFGTRMYVPGYGLAVAEDTGGGVKGRFIDLGYDDFNYKHWGQVVTVYFLTPIPPADHIRWIIPSTVP